MYQLETFIGKTFSKILKIDQELQRQSIFQNKFAQGIVFKK